VDVKQDDLARRVFLEVGIGGHDATAFMEPYLTSFEYTDHAAGKSDEISIELHDRDGKWIEEWLPSKGTAISASLRCLNWHGPGRHMGLTCGKFTADEVSCSGSPTKVSIKGVSASLSGQLRETAHTRAWEGFSLQGVARDIAGRNGLALYYDADAHPFERQDQRNESDLAFVQRLAEDRGVNLKVRDDKLILFSAKEADGRASMLSFVRTGDDYGAVSEWEFKSKSEGTAYTACTVEYHDPATKELRTYTYNPSGKALTENNTRKVYPLDNRVESEAGAMSLARNSLRKQNQGETTGSFTVFGNPGLVAGMTVDMSGFGKFSGKYFVDKTTHSVGGKYTTKAEIRGVLEY
jgi:phage protein D